MLATFGLCFVKENFVAGFAKRLRRQLDLLTQFLLSYFVARETIRLCRGNLKLETSWRAPLFGRQRSRSCFFQYLRAQKPSKKHVGQPVTMLQGFSML